MMQARSLVTSGLMEFLCRPPQESDRDAALEAAARATLSAPGARRAWVKLQTHEFEASGTSKGRRFPYGVEVPVDLAGRICGTVGLEADQPVNESAHARAAAIADFLATWEARRCLGAAVPEHTIVGCSAEMRHVELFARRYAALDEPVLIEGETGVGKELVAQTLHCLSSRRDQALWTINCAAVPDELIVSELFGHRRGAFTGAVRDQKGRFEMADGATLFLDEIGEMGPGLQAALLRVLEYGEVQQLGDEGRMRRINVRVIAASNRNLSAAVEAGRFRSDLYFRLTPLTINVPPLRDRPEDIPILARYFLSVLEERWGQKLQVVAEALDGLIEYPFPGNVRELRNLVLRAAATCCEGRIETIPLPSLAVPFSIRAMDSRLAAKRAANGNGRHARASNADGDAALVFPRGAGRAARNSAAVDFVPGNGRSSGTASAVPGTGRTDTTTDPLTLDWATAAHLRRVLTMAKGNVSRAARMLDIPRTTLQSKLRRYGVH